MKAILTMLRHESAPGCLLVMAALLAMIVANTSLGPLYRYVLSIPVSIQLGNFSIDKPLLLWINDGLMAIFFFTVGLEIKREILQGHLSSADRVLLPAIAAMGGIAAPALVYAWINHANPIAMQGWAVPSATDIAFAIGVFSLFGRSLPCSLKLFLLSVAIFDDIGAIIIIALFYSTELSTVSLLVACGGLSTLFALNRLGVNRQSLYIMVALVVWAAVLKSGVHATLAGFVVAWFIPMRLQPAREVSMLHNLERGLGPWVVFFILPAFAFGNAGVDLVSIGLQNMLNPVTIGVALGLFFGKQVGVFGICWLVVRAGLARMPAGATWIQLYGVSLLCGIGFTMSLFIGTLAFENQGMAYLDNIKIGVILGSMLSALLGLYVLLLSRTGFQDQPLHRRATPA